MTNIDHYFDWAGTSPSDEDILTSSLQETLKNWGNPSSSHQIGKDAKSILENARNVAAKAMGVSPQTIYFTSGGTESDQIPLLALLAKPAKGTVLFSSIEHPAVREQALALKNCGWNVVSIPSDKNGIITPQAVLDTVTSDTMLVCVMAVNNETGAIQPIYEIADAITKWADGKRKPKFHVDCVQAAGKIPLKLAGSGIDSAAFSSHKICGPRGIGILYLKNSMEVFLRGGGQENGIRSGTENVFGALAFSKALERYYNCQHYDTQKKITYDFIANLTSLPNCTIIPPGRIENPNLYSPYVVQAAFKNIPGNVMVRALDSKGFCISTGSACSTKKNNRPVLEAMKVSADLRETSVRFSFGPKTTENGVKELFEAVKDVYKQFNNLEK